MSRFTGPLHIEFSEVIGRHALTLEPLIWEMNALGSGQFVVVPKGFKTDGGTIPRFIWWLLPPWGDIATRAYVLHDYLRSCISWGRPDVYAPTFADCDRQLYLALRALGVDKFRAGLVFGFVRLHSLIVGDKGEAFGPPV